MVNISTTIRTTAGPAQTLNIRGILTGMAESSRDIRNFQSSLVFDTEADSVTIGDEVYTLRLLPFPDASAFEVDESSFFLFPFGYSSSSADLYGSLTVTSLADSLAAPEPSSVLALLIGGGVTGTWAWARRRKASVPATV